MNKSFRIAGNQDFHSLNIDIGTSVLYSKKYLNDAASPKTFLKSVSYNVDLSSLLQVERTCAYHEGMDYCPVLIKINSEEIRRFYGENARYIIQVYDREGDYDIASWNIFFNYFIFKLDKREEDGGWIYVVKFDKSKATVLKVKDIANHDSYTNLAVSQELLYYGNEKDVKVIDIKGHFKEGQVTEISEASVLHTNLAISGQTRLLGFFENTESHDNNYLLCIIETKDNQIDFAKLTFNTRELVMGDFEFFQIREVVRRDNVSNDNIAKYRHFITIDDHHFCCSLRQSGQVDFYHDYQLIDQSEEKFVSIEMNSRYIYLLQRIPTKNPMGLSEDMEQIIQIDLTAGQRIGVDVGVIAKFKLSYWRRIAYDLIKKYVRLFSAISLVNTHFFVSYDRIVSMYDVVAKKWKNHFVFDCTIVELLRNQRGSKAADLNIAVYLKDGSLRTIDCVNKKMDQWDILEASMRIEGKLMSLVSDWRDISSHYILTKTSNGKLQLTGFQHGALTDLNGSTKIQDNEELIRCVTPNEEEDFVLLDRKGGKIRTFINKNSHSEKMIVCEGRKPLKIQNLEKFDKNFHCVVGSKNEEYLLLFTTSDVIKLKVSDGTTQTLKDFNVQSLQVIDQDYCYSLSNESEKQKAPGFFIQNVNAFIEKTNETSNFMLKPATVGQNDHLDYYKDDQRIAYMSSYESIKIVPVLHRCVIGFIGMKPREEYLTFKRIKDRLMALDRKGRITTWSVLTGKVLELKSASQNFDIGDYEVFQNGPDDITYRSQWYQSRVLLINKSHSEKMNEEQFFGERLDTDLGSKASYIRSISKTFNRFKVIEISDDGDMVEHFSFVHAYYGDHQYQRLYFSDDLRFMLERQEQNVLFYEREDEFKGAEGQEVRWRLIRRLKQFPLDLSECTFVNYLFSPDLQLYLDFDKSDNIFVIKRTKDQTWYCSLSSGLMNPGDGKEISLVGKKFKWLDNRLIRVVNNDGIEKTVDITDNCKQISYCTIPMLDLDILKQNEKSHFYYDININNEAQTMQRLIRKYQTYFSAYNSDGIRSPIDLYEILFDVDFNVNNCKGKVISQISFTYFHWKLAEVMEQSPKFNIKRYQPEEIKILALNIFPRGKTVLHYAYKNLQIIRRFYRVIEHEIETENEKPEEERQGFAFEIPFIKNFDKQTPLHLCIKDNSYKSANIILQKLCKDPLDSHMRAILDLLPKLVQAELPCLGDYFDSRFTQTQLCKDFRRGALKYYNGVDYSLAVADLWPDKTHLTEKIFDTKSQIDTEVKVEFLDVVGVHCYSEKVGDDFFDSLAGCKNIDMFKYRSLQTIIDYKWPLAREYTIKMLFVPFCFYLAIFIAYSNAFNGQVSFEEPGMYEADKVLSAILYIFSVYFLQNECRQLYLSGFEYLTQIWNYADFVPPCLIITIVSMHLKIQQDGIENLDYAGLASIHAVASFLMWFKLIYFLRIFKQTGYLVRMLTDVIAEMKVFLLILGIVLLAFGEAFLRLSEMSDDGAHFAGNYAYTFVYTFRLAIGDTFTDPFNTTVQPVVLWIFFCLCLLITNVVMLNLLIAIISEVFQKVNSNYQLANYQEKARIIAENCYLIPNYRKRANGLKSEYLIIAREITESEEVDNVDLAQKVKDIVDEQMKSLKKEMNDKNIEISDQLKEILLALKK